MFAIGFLPILGGVLGGAGLVGSFLGGRGAERRARRFEGEALDVGRGALRRARGGFLERGGFQRQEDARRLAMDLLNPEVAGREISRHSALLGAGATRAAEAIRPQFERGLRESIGGVVGGLGRRGGLVDRTVGEAGQDFTRTVGRDVAGNVPAILQSYAERAGGARQMFGQIGQFARMDEDTFLQILGEIIGQEQGRASAARRGFGNLLGLGGGLIGRFG